MSEGTERIADLSKDHYAAIGQVVVAWSEFEILLDITTLVLAKIKMKVGFCLTAQIAGSGRKLDAYIAIARGLGATKTVKAMNAFAKDTVGLAEQRNRVVHDSWSGLGTPNRFEVTAKRVLRAETIPVSVDDLTKLAKRIDEHTQRFYNLSQDVKAEVET